MSQHTALVTGATGLLGRQVVKAFQAAGWNVVGTGLTRANSVAIRKLDLLDKEAVERCLDEVKPDVVVHCAAIRHPSLVQHQPHLTHALNVLTPIHLAHLSTRLSFLLLYISTDYVFPGRPGEAPYAPDAETAPTNAYGVSKRDGERGVLDTAREGWGLVVRVPLLYGEVETLPLPLPPPPPSAASSEPQASSQNHPSTHPGHSASRKNNAESAVNVLLNVLRDSHIAAEQAQHKGRQVQKTKVDDWAIRYPTNTLDVARVLVSISHLYLPRLRAGTASKLPRILHFSAEEGMTKYRMCEVFAGILGVGLDGVEADREGASQDGVERPFDCHLVTGELRGLGVDVRAVGFEEWWRKELGCLEG